MDSRQRQLNRSIWLVPVAKVRDAVVFDLFGVPLSNAYYTREGSTSGLQQLIASVAFQPYLAVVEAQPQWNVPLALTVPDRIRRMHGQAADEPSDSLCTDLIP